MGWVRLQQQRGCEEQKELPAVVYVPRRIVLANLAPVWHGVASLHNGVHSTVLTLLQLLGMLMPEDPEGGLASIALLCLQCWRNYRTIEWSWHVTHAFSGARTTEYASLT